MNALAGNFSLSRYVVTLCVIFLSGGVLSFLYLYGLVPHVVFALLGRNLWSLAVGLILPFPVVATWLLISFTSYFVPDEEAGVVSFLPPAFLFGVGESAGAMLAARIEDVILSQEVFVAVVVLSFVYAFWGMRIAVALRRY